MQAVGPLQGNWIGLLQLLVLSFDFGPRRSGDQDRIVSDHGSIAVAQLIAVDRCRPLVECGHPRPFGDVQRPVGLQLVETRQARRSRAARAPANLRRIVHLGQNRPLVVRERARDRLEILPLAGLAIEQEQSFHHAPRFASRNRRRLEAPRPRRMHVAVVLLRPARLRFRHLCEQDEGSSLFRGEEVAGVLIDARRLEHRIDHVDDGVVVEGVVRDVTRSGPCPRP